MKPFDLLKQWLHEEQQAGVSEPHRAVLSTATREAVPHARVVAIREISEEGVLFFTQRGTRKVNELTTNPVATFTFWFELLQREVIVEGQVVPLSEPENDFYWQSYSREAQIRHYTCAPTSSQPLASKQLLEDKRKQIELEFADRNLPLGPYYCGFRLQPDRFVFYAYRSDVLSEVYEYRQTEQEWIEQLLSP